MSDLGSDRIDLSSDPGSPQPEAAASSRRYLGVHFACCGVYARIYVNADESAYRGNCPRCGKVLSIKIGPGGTDERFFTAW